MGEKERFISFPNLRVGIIYNFPVTPSKGIEMDYVADAEVEEEVEIIETTLDKLDLKSQLLPLKDNIIDLMNSLNQYNPDVIINLCEGAYGDSHLEMAVPSMLELLRVPYTGCTPLALGLCQNKGLSKDIMRAEGISTPNYRVMSQYTDLRGELLYPLFVKPLSEDASIGVTRNSFVENDVELKRQINYIIESYKQPALVEEYIAGREVNVAILEDIYPKVLPISEIRFDSASEPKIVDYSAKWFKDTNEYKNTVPECPAKLNHETNRILEKIALKVYSKLLCRDYARVDIRIKGKIPYVLEVNPNPDISLDGGFARSLNAAKISYEEFLSVIISSALKRKK
jgi:D-alanine-D-alanine ligase